MLSNREFSVANEHAYDRSSPVRWIAAHIVRYPLLPIIFVLTAIGMAASQSLGACSGRPGVRYAVGGGGRQALARAALLGRAAYLGYGACDIVNSLVLRVLAQRVERDTRDELYLSLLGKSQTFHNRQRVGDLMARATNDVQQISLLISPGLGLVIESVLTLLRAA